MPRDFDELVRFHGELISTIAGPEGVLLVAHHLWYRGILEAFKPPRELTRDQVIAYLGLHEGGKGVPERGGGRPWAFRMWSVAARTRPDALPKPLDNGSLEQPESKYLFSDAERCYARRREVFPRMAELGFFPSDIPGFEDFLLAETRKLVEELELGYIFDAPIDLPQTREELFCAYSATVARVVRFQLKFGMDVEDAINEVWLKLLNSNLVVKFMRSGPKRLPAHMTTDEVLDYLGVEYRAWRRMLNNYEGAPNPVKGAADSLEALYRSEDIRALDESGYFKKRGLRYLPASSVSREIFDKYVTTAAEHALMNLFRKLDRRFNKEETLQDGACIQENRRVRVLRRDDPTDVAWEDTLSSAGPPPLSGSGFSAIPADAMVDIRRRLPPLEVLMQAEGFA